jgi:hypothetical protein
MNLEEKTKLFGHYLFCDVKAGDVIATMHSIDGNSGCVNSLGNVVQLPIEDCKLILKDLKDITHKEAMACAGLANLPASLYKNWQLSTNMYGHAIFSFPEDENYRNMIVFKEDKLNFLQVDYLRSRGYRIAVPDDCFEKYKETVQL